MMYGIDISNWQAGFPLASASRALDFVILKASEYGWKNGNGGVDQQFAGFAATATQKGLRLGAYLFARDTRHGSVDAQVDLFIKACGQYLSRVLLVLDWEDTSYSRVQGNVALCRQFLDTIKRKTGKTPMLYTSQSEVRYNDYSSIKAAGYPLWGACYLNVNANQAAFIPDPALPSGGWGAYGSRPAIYQYSSSGWLDGWKLDVNVACMSKADWDRLAGGGSPSPTPGKLDVDGWAGPATIRRMQELMVSPYADGVISGQFKPNAKFYDHITSVQFDGGSGDSWMVKELQKKLKVDVDGVLGRFTIKAWQSRLIGIGYDCGPYGADGFFGADSAKALQRALNDNRW